MIRVGNLEIFGFEIGPETAHSEMRDVSIYINNTDLTVRDNSAYLPSFVSQLEATSEYLKNKIDYVRYEAVFADLNLSQIHNLLLHGDASRFPDEREWWNIWERHRFGCWGETTDGFRCFLIPFRDQLYLTYQLHDDVLDVIDGVQTTPHYLIQTLDEAISTLKPWPAQ